MQYLFLLYDDETMWTSMPDAERDALFGEYMTYTEELRKAGAYVAGAPLQPTATGAKVSLKGGDRRVEDGPFTDSKEQLGGFYRIEAKDLDAALDWAAKCPSARIGAVEVRPIWKMD